MSLELQTAPSFGIGAGIRPALPAAATSEVDGSRVRRRRKNVRVHVVRVGLLVAWVASWQLAATYWIDPFFFSKPSAIWDRLVQWFTEGTAFGSIWLQIEATLHGRHIGLPDRLGGRDRARRPAGAQPFPRRRLRAVHQGRQRHPAHRARLALRDLVRTRHVLQGGHRRGARVLRRVLQRLPRRPGGGPHGDRQRPHPRRPTAPSHDLDRAAKRGVVDHRQPAHGLRLRPHRRRRRRVHRRRQGPRAPHQQRPRHLRRRRDLRRDDHHHRHRPRRRVADQRGSNGDSSPGGPSPSPIDPPPPHHQGDHDETTSVQRDRRLPRRSPPRHRLQPVVR